MQEEKLIILTKSVKERLFAYLKRHKIKKHEFAQMLGISRVTLYNYLNNAKQAPLSVKLAVEYLTTGEIRRKDW